MTRKRKAHRGAVIERRGHLFWLVDAEAGLWLDRDGDTWNAEELADGDYRLVFAGAPLKLKEEPEQPTVTVQIVNLGEQQ